MSTIYRYPLAVTEYRNILALQGDPIWIAPGRNDQIYTLDVWAYHLDHHTERTAEFFTIGTGHPLPGAAQGNDPNPAAFLGTCVMPDGLVWHTFWRWV